MTSDTPEVTSGSSTSGSTTTSEGTGWICDGLLIRGEAAGDNAGWDVALVGDMDGDGLEDVLVGAPGVDDNAGRAYIVFGKSEEGTVELTEVLDGTGGYAVLGMAAGERVGASVAGTGDLDQDGYPDFVVGAWHSEIPGLDAGRAYVVFGGSGDGSLELGEGGEFFRILNGEEGDYAGMSVASGDVSGDGLPDVIVGASGAEGRAGRVYVVFGPIERSSQPVALSAIADQSAGLLVEGATPNTGHVVSVAGDVNGDGLSDILVGAPDATTLAEDVGRAYVVFGRTEASTLFLADIEAGMGGGRVFLGAEVWNRTGWAAAGAGDLDLDGFADVVIGAPYYPSEHHIGRAYVAYGGPETAPLHLTTIVDDPGAGFVVEGSARWDNAGFAASAAGDVNGDGRQDLAITALLAGPDDADSGRVYVLFSEADMGTVELADFPGNVDGLVLEGSAPGDEAGASVAGGSDVNGDGTPDLVVGMPGADPNGSLSGQVCVFFL